MVHHSVIGSDLTDIYLNGNLPDYIFKCSFEALVLSLSISILFYFLIVLQYISEGNIVLFTPLHLCGVTFRLKIYIKNTYDKLIKIQYKTPYSDECLLVAG